jgi:hypothetical protein
MVSTSRIVNRIAVYVFIKAYPRTSFSEILISRDGPFNMVKCKTPVLLYSSDSVQNSGSGFSGA